MIAHGAFCFCSSATDSYAAFQGANARHFVKQGAGWKLGDRWLLGYASAASMPVPDDASDDAKADTIPIPSTAVRDTQPPPPSPDETLKP